MVPEVMKKGNSQKHLQINLSASASKATPYTPSKQGHDESANMQKKISIFENE